MILSRNRTIGLALIALIVSSILPKVHSENVVRVRGNAISMHKAKRKANIVNIPEPKENQVHMSVVNEKYHEYLQQQDNFLSSTIRFSLYPIQYTIDESQASLFEMGLASFLRAILSSQPQHQFRILAASVTNVKSIGIADTKDSEPMVKDHTLELQTVVSAQQNTDDVNDWITYKEFGDIIINLCSIYEDELIKSVKDSQDEYIDDDNEIFSRVERIDAALDRLVFGSGLTALGKGIVACFSILAVVLVGLFFLVRYTRSK